MPASSKISTSVSCEPEEVQTEKTPNTNTVRWRMFLEPLNLIAYLDDIVDADVNFAAMVDVGRQNAYLLDKWLQELNFPVEKRILLTQKFLSDDIEDILSYDEDSSQKSRKSIWWYGVPLVNIVYDVLFDEAPTIDTIKDFLNMFGLMGALVFTVAVTLPLSFDYEVFEGVIERWGPGGVYDGCWTDGYAQIEYFIYHCTLATTFCFLAVILVLLYYLVLVNLKMKSAKALEVWWLYTKWVVVIIFILLVVGVWATFMALQNVTEWNVPNRKAIDQDCTHILQENDNVWGTSVHTVVISCCTILTLCIAILSLAIRMKSKQD